MDRLGISHHFDAVFDIIEAAVHSQTRIPKSTRSSLIATVSTQRGL